MHTPCMPPSCSLPCTSLNGIGQYANRHNASLRANALNRRCRGRAFQRTCVKAAFLPFEAAGKGDKEYQLRLYNPRFVVEMPYTSRDKAYMAFDQYLTGKNDAKMSLETLSPVVMRHEPDKGTKVMQMFVMPLGTRLQPEMLTQQPPLPDDPKLSLNIAGGEAVSVLRFSGQATKEATYRALAELKSFLQRDRQQMNTFILDFWNIWPDCRVLPDLWLIADGVELADASTFSVAQYDPVHALRERTNEVWLAVRL